MTAPGPAPDRAAAERVRLFLDEGCDCGHAPWSEIEAVLAELDRQRGLIAAVLAACSEAEAVAGWNTARVTVAEIWALLGGEGR